MFQLAIPKVLPPTRKTAHSLNIGIVPLVIAFLLIFAIRVSAVLR